MIAKKKTVPGSSAPTATKKNDSVLVVKKKSVSDGNTALDTDTDLNEIPKGEEIIWKNVTYTLTDGAKVCKK